MSDDQLFTGDGDNVDEASAPANEREYVLWMALSHAPYPPRTGRALADLYDQRLSWSDVDWLRDYNGWYQTERLKAMKDSPMGTQSYQLFRKDEENRLLRDLLRKAYSALDNTQLMQDIATTLARLEGDIDY